MNHWLTVASLVISIPSGIGAPAEPGSPTNGVRVLRDVAYLAAGRSEKLDLYLPPQPVDGRRFPAVLIVHGGGWVGGSKSAAREQSIGLTLAGAGFVCASVD